jgi:hypothetical protein
MALLAPTTGAAASEMELGVHEPCMEQLQRPRSPNGHAMEQTVGRGEFERILADRCVLHMLPRVFRTTFSTWGTLLVRDKSQSRSPDARVSPQISC